mmetsp:Transcript_22420/g.46734  ORF Transcript_22420/g.46734 Transcript_22420/m.46734 type:complete len:100 (-) Transcript_22420:117-416(-)
MSTNDPELVAMSVSSSTDAGEAAAPGGDKRKLSQTQGKPPFSLSSLPQARDDRITRIWDRVETRQSRIRRVRFGWQLGRTTPEAQASAATPGPSAAGNQ